MYTFPQAPLNPWLYANLAMLAAEVDYRLACLRLVKPQRLMTMMLVRIKTRTTVVNIRIQQRRDENHRAIEMMSVARERKDLGHLPSEGATHACLGSDINNILEYAQVQRYRQSKALPVNGSQLLLWNYPHCNCTRVYASCHECYCGSFSACVPSRLLHFRSQHRDWNAILPNNLATAS